MVRVLQGGSEAARLRSLSRAPARPAPLSGRCTSRVSKPQCRRGPAGLCAGSLPLRRRNRLAWCAAACCLASAPWRLREEHAVGESRTLLVCSARALRPWGPWAARVAPQAHAAALRGPLLALLTCGLHITSLRSGRPARARRHLRLCAGESCGMPPAHGSRMLHQAASSTFALVSAAQQGRGVLRSMRLPWFACRPGHYLPHSTSMEGWSSSTCLGALPRHA